MTRALHLRRLLGGLVLLLLGTGFTGCGTQSEETGGAQPQGANLRIVIGTQDFPEAKLLGELWRQALSADGYVVDLRKAVGAAEELDAALIAGDIDGYVAYTGTVLSIVAQEEVTGLDAEETYARAEEFYAGQNMSMSAMTAFENKDAIATTVAYAQRHGLRTIEDLAELSGIRLGARPEFSDLQLGMTGLEDVYGLSARFVPIKLGGVYQALDNGRIQAGNVFTTDPELQSGDYRVLDDTELLFGSQNAVMTVDSDKLESVGKEEFLDVVDSVNARLSKDVMIRLNEQVTGGAAEADVARQFLREQGLL